MTRPLLAIVALFLLPFPAFARSLTIRGYVTAITSPTSFEVGDYAVTCDATVALVSPSDAVDGPEDKTAKKFAGDIRIGTELEVTGDYDDRSGQLKAKSIKAFSQDTLALERTALLDKLPELTKEGPGWRGFVYADGQKITVLPETPVAYRPTRAERRNRLAAARSKDFQPPALGSLDLDTFVHYQGKREADGSITAQSLMFLHPELGAAEARLWSWFEPRVTEPDYAALRPGELRVLRKSYKLVPSREAQDYVSRLGESLVPAHQKELPSNDPRKIPFRFYLVESDEFNAVCYPNGVVVVHSGVFDVLENEAQLAFVLAHEISHALEKHAWLAYQSHRKELLAMRMGGGAFQPMGGSVTTSLLAAELNSSYVRSLENQADRVGLQWMLASGYDVREAPQSWRAASQNSVDSLNSFWASHDNYTTRRSYLMAELRNNFSAVDYSSLKKDSQQFHDVARLVRDLESVRNRVIARAGQ